MKRRRKSRRPSLVHYFEFASIGFFAAIARIIPRHCYSAVASGLSMLWFYVFPFRRQVVQDNLRIAFPSEHGFWRNRISRDCMAHFVRMALEFADIRRRGPLALKEMVESIEGREHYDAVGAEHSPYVFVTGHFGNWELAVSYFTAFEGINIAVLAKPLHNPLVERVVAESRTKRGYEVIYTRGEDLRKIVRIAKQGRPLGFLADQDARRNGIFVEFFSRPASTFQGPALFAHRLNIPMLIGTCCRSKSTGRFRIRFYPPVIPDPEANREEEIQRLTQAHVAILEAAIRENPEQYFWFHKRWKTQPKKRQSEPEQKGPRVSLT